MFSNCQMCWNIFSHWFKACCRLADCDSGQCAFIIKRKFSTPLAHLLSLLLSNLCLFHQNRFPATHTRSNGTHSHSFVSLEGLPGTLQTDEMKRSCQKQPLLSFRFMIWDVETELYFFFFLFFFFLRLHAFDTALVKRQSAKRPSSVLSTCAQSCN